MTTRLVGRLPAGLLFAALSAVAFAPQIVRAQTNRTTFASGLSNPVALTLDSAGNVLVAEHGAARITRFPAAGGAGTTVVSGVSVPFAQVYDASGNLYISLLEVNQIVRLAPGGGITPVASVGFPCGLALDLSGNVIVGSFFDSSVQQVTPAGAVTTRYTGFSGPAGIVYDSAGNFYVASREDDIIYKFTPAGVRTILTQGGAVRGPEQMAFDSVGNMYVANIRNASVAKITPAGASSPFLTGLSLPRGVVINNSTGTLYVSDWTLGTITSVSIPVSTPPVINSPATASGTFGASYPLASPLYKITATNNPTSFSAAFGGLTGLAANPSTGEITGTPGSAGSFTIGLAASNSAGTGTGTAVLNIAPAAATITFDNLTQIYDGSPKSVSASVTPSAAGVSLTYNGSTTAPKNVGTYNVAAKTTNANYVASPNPTTTVLHIVDGTAPVLTLPANITAEATSAGGAIVTFSATATDDVDGSVAVSLSPDSGSLFPLGTTTVNASARDAAGNRATGSFTVTVSDTTKPVITSLTPSIKQIWPPNKKMVAVNIGAVATDAGGPTSLKIVSVATNEPNGDTQWQITGALTLNLLADRNGNGAGRIYTITVEAKDAAGNVSTKTTTVTVPHDQGK